MALDVTRLAGAMATAMEANIRTAESLGSTPYPQLTSYCQGVCNAIASCMISELQNHAALNGAVTAQDGVVRSSPGGAGTIVGYTQPNAVSGGIA